MPGWSSTKLQGHLRIGRRCGRPSEQIESTNLHCCTCAFPENGNENQSPWPSLAQSGALLSAEQLGFRDPVSHCPVAPLPFDPHAAQRWMTCVDEVDNSDSQFAGVLAMQSASILLQRSFPRDRHGKHQGVQRRMVKAFTNQPASCQQDSRRLGRERVQFRAISSDLSHLWFDCGSFCDLII